jgi:hypothetical protein
MCDCDKNKKVKKDKYKEEKKDKEEKEVKGKNKTLCKTVKFTLVVTLNFKNGNSEKLKSHFNSKPDIGCCNLPETKDFTKAYRKLMKKYSESLPKDSLSKATSPTIVSRNTQIYSTVGQDAGCAIGGCACKNLPSFPCGTTKPGDKCLSCNNKGGKATCFTKCG